MSPFAAIVLDPGSIASWIVLGLVSGWLACKLMEVPSYGMGGDLILGSLGGLLGGVVVGMIVAGTPEWWMSLVVALIGACILIGVARTVSAARSA